MNSRAQGTIEYLVIIAVVIVIALVATVLFLSISETSTTNISNNSSQLKGITSGPISVVESAVDSTGEGKFHLQNLTGESLSLVSVAPKSDPNNSLPSTLRRNSDGSYDIFVTDLNSWCTCDASGKVTSCDLIIKVEKASTIKISIPVSSSQCSGDIIIDGIPSQPSITLPHVVLLSPANGNQSTSRSISFDFNYSGTFEPSTCQLVLNGVSQEIINSNLVKGVNTISKEFTTDKLVDWNITCVDTNSNSATSSSFVVDIDASPSQITTCAELQEMNNDVSGEYALLNNIDCSDTVNWNSGAGFNPVGDFIGKFDGNYYVILNLFINRPLQSNIGLFGKIRTDSSSNTPLIQNIKLVNFNITGHDAVGSLAGVVIPYAQFSVINIQRVSSSGFIHGNSEVGGLIGDTSGSASTVNISQAMSSAEVYSSGERAAGLVGNSVGTIIIDSYALGDINSGTFTAGFVGFKAEAAETRCFSSGQVTNRNIGTYSGGFYSYNPAGGITSQSYWDTTTSGYTTGSYGATGKTTSEMMQQSTFSGWDFTNVWNICQGFSYPFLRWENKSC